MMDYYVYGRRGYTIAIVVVVYLIELVLNLFGMSGFLYPIIL